VIERITTIHTHVIERGSVSTVLTATG